MKTMYDESYVKPGAVAERHTKNDIQKQLIQLRSSNILMGTQGQDYNTMFMEDYVIWFDLVQQGHSSLQKGTSTVRPQSHAL